MLFRRNLGILMIVLYVDLFTCWLHLYMEWAKVGLWLWVCETQEFILVILFTNYCIMYVLNYKPTFAHPV